MESPQSPLALSFKLGAALFRTVDGEQEGLVLSFMAPKLGLRVVASRIVSGIVSVMGSYLGAWR